MWSLLCEARYHCGEEGSKKGKRMETFPLTMLSAFSQFQAHQTVNNKNVSSGKCVIRKKAVMFSTITTSYSLLIRVNFCACNAPITHAKQDFLGLDWEILNIRPVAHVAGFQMLQIQLESGKTGMFALSQF